MSYAAPPPPGTPRTRPTTVTVSTLLLLLVAVLYAIQFLVAVSQAGTWNDIFRESLAGTDADGAEGVATGVLVGTAAIGLLLGIGFVILAIFNNQGRNGARITTWVLAGISMCCGVLGLFGAATSSSGFAGGDVDQDLANRLAEENLPSWYNAANIGTSALMLVALVLVVILLALPASNEFFRKQRPEDIFEPPSYPPPPPAG